MQYAAGFDPRHTRWRADQITVSGYQPPAAAPPAAEASRPTSMSKQAPTTSSAAASSNSSAAAAMGVDAAADGSADADAATSEPHASSSFAAPPPTSSAPTNPLFADARTKWSAEEIVLFEQGLAQFGAHAPAKIAAHMGTRHREQVRERIKWAKKKGIISKDGQLLAAGGENAAVSSSAAALPSVTSNNFGTAQIPVPANVGGLAFAPRLPPMQQAYFPSASSSSSSAAAAVSGMDVSQFAAGSFSLQPPLPPQYPASFGSGGRGSFFGTSAYASSAAAGAAGTARNTTLTGAAEAVETLASLASASNSPLRNSQRRDGVSGAAAAASSFGYGIGLAPFGTDDANNSMAQFGLPSSNSSSNGNALYSSSAAFGGAVHGIGNTPGHSFLGGTLIFADGHGDGGISNAMQEEEEDEDAGFVRRKPGRGRGRGQPPKPTASAGSGRGRGRGRVAHVPLPAAAAGGGMFPQFTYTAAPGLAPFGNIFQSSSSQLGRAQQMQQRIADGPAADLDDVDEALNDNVGGSYSI